MIKTANTQSIILPTFIQPVGENTQKGNKFDLLQPIRERLDTLEIQSPKLAKFIAKFIPAQCPFERDIVVFGRTIAHIPPLCKLNPLYDQFVGLRFRALCYLVDQCGEDIQSYC
ncbi:MAG TPA: Mo-dependent nitrogenase C-terminal domain-containing protein [Nostocaceae cyanobacterium]|nr:Mo-dependent nitrogenase C-terminal domain-containing protein [Nostocaceae cyanobacterium]